VINKLVVDTLSILGIPVSFQKYSGGENTYITFFEYLRQGESYADNLETCTGHYIQVDLWCKGDYTTIAKDILDKMKNAGFRRTTETEIYEEETQTYHKVLRFFYEEEVV
jgi:hypothetical protein